ncbi:Ms5788A family Cys-rich leader peptide [Paractinoplanes lichenicola]|uniref:Ms5788A family Cys-rich leader peptide n=1 Tax=Paractinoplanes lichenicola TaxID=2802976 RepID=UPI0034DB68CA
MCHSTRADCDPRHVPGSWSSLLPAHEPLVGSVLMSPLLTKRRAVDLCRMAACLCCPVI